MQYLNEIITYLGTRDARFTIYGSLLGLLVIYVTRVMVRALKAWQQQLAAGSQRSAKHFLVWVLYHYRQCPRWLRFVSRCVAKVLALFNINLMRTARKVSKQERLERAARKVERAPQAKNSSKRTRKQTYTYKI